MCRQDEAGFPQKQLETAFLHSLRLLEQNREYLQMHLQPLKDARAAQALEDMEQEAARLERTFRELMELSAPEKPVQKRPVDLCRLLAQLEGLRGEIDAQSSTKLTVDCGGLEQCLVWGDREMAEQICFHLLSNALRAAAPGGNIQVCLRQTGQDIRLTIEDDGCGLPEGESWPELLHELGFKTVALALRDDSLALNDPRLLAEPKLAMVLGTEGDGLASSTIAACDYTVKIPMSHGVDSLNVAAASAVAFYQLALLNG